MKSMTPSSPVAGLLTGLVDGLVIALLVMLVVMLNNRRHRVSAARIRPTDREVDTTIKGTLHRAD
jgi:hypothetical protein